MKLGTLVLQSLEDEVTEQIDVNMHLRCFLLASCLCRNGISPLIHQHMLYCLNPPLSWFKSGVLTKADNQRCKFKIPTGDAYIDLSYL